MTTRKSLLAVFGIFVTLPLYAADPLKVTEFTKMDMFRLLDAKAWSFTYSLAEPVRRLDLLIYEERTDEAGKTTTTIHNAVSFITNPNELTYPIKMLLVGNDLHAGVFGGSGGSGGFSIIKVSEDFARGAANYNRQGNGKEDQNGRRFLMEVFNTKNFNGMAPFKNEIKFKIYENLDQPKLKLLLDGGQLPETPKAEQIAAPNEP